eukprot:5493536-Prymnesium_polylepis.1
MSGGWSSPDEHSAQCTQYFPRSRKRLCLTWLRVHVTAVMRLIPSVHTKRGAPCDARSHVA